MGRIGLAFRLLFKTLFDGEFARRVGEFVSGKAEPAPPRVVEKPTAAAVRSEAITLLSVLQREARLVDFLMEPIEGYGDAQIGAAVRDVHRDAAATLRRCFALGAVMEQEEGSEVQLSTPVDANRVRLVGNVSGAATRGRLVHRGWQAAKVELPQYSGGVETARVIAPAEVEV
jgi:hypothetical protein